MGLEERIVESDNALFQASLDAGVETKSDTTTLNRHVTGEGGSLPLGRIVERTRPKCDTLLT